MYSVIAILSTYYVTYKGGLDVLQLLQVQPVIISLSSSCLNVATHVLQCLYVNLLANVDILVTSSSSDVVAKDGFCGYFWIRLYSADSVEAVVLP